MKKPYLLYKEKGFFYLLSTEEIPNSKKITLLNQEFFLAEDDSLDFIFQTFNAESIFITDSYFIQNYGARLKKLNYLFIDANKYLFAPAKYVFNLYKINQILSLILKCNYEKQNISIPDSYDIVAYTDKIFSYVGSSQQMNLHIIKNVFQLINDELYLFNPTYLKKTNLIKNSEEKELNFLDKNVFFRLYYITHLYEGFVEADFIEFNSAFLNKMIGKKGEYSFLVPFYWIRIFKDEIYNLGLKNTIYIAPRIKFNIKTLCSLKGLILKDKFQELYIKQQILGFLLKEYSDKIYTINLNNYTLYSPYKMNSSYLKNVGVV